MHARKYLVKVNGRPSTDERNNGNIVSQVKATIAIANKGTAEVGGGGMQKQRTRVAGENPCHPCHFKERKNEKPPEVNTISSIA